MGEAGTSNSVGKWLDLNDNPDLLSSEEYFLVFSLRFYLLGNGWIAVGGASLVLACIWRIQYEGSNPFITSKKLLTIWHTWRWAKLKEHYKP